MIKITETKTNKNPHKPLREVEVAYEIDEYKCKQCVDRPCLQACPVKAVHETPPDKHIEIDDKCFGCLLCREACPYDAIKMETILAESVKENMPVINLNLCIHCGSCISACRVGSMELVSTGGEETELEIDDTCIRCGYCARVCPTEAIKFGKILPRSVAGGKAMVIDQKSCIGCMACVRICPAEGAMNIGTVSKLPFIDPSYCVRCDECMDVCPTDSIRYLSTEKAYPNFGKIKTMEIVYEILEKETKRLASDVSAIERILNRISVDLSYENTDDEFEIDVTSRIKAEIESVVHKTMDIEDLKDIIKHAFPKRNIAVIDENCIGCTLCMSVCPTNAIELETPSPVHIGSECVYCGRCIEMCPFKAISLKEEYFKARSGQIFYVRENLEGSRTGEVVIDSELCQLCEVCVNKCPADAMSIEGDRVVVDREKCILCDACEVICPLDAVRLKT